MIGNYPAPTGAAPVNWRELCRELTGHLERSEWPPKYKTEIALTLDAARASLAECSENPEENKWVKRVDSHDALAVAKAVLYDWGYLVK